MAGIQRGLGAMFQSIGQSMGKWEDQKKQNEQLAMQRALQARQLELAELRNEREEREADATIQQRDFENTMAIANVTPENSSVQPEFAAKLREHRMGGMLTPGQSYVSVPNLRGIPGPITPINNPTLPEKFTGTMPPALRAAAQNNEARLSIAEQRNALQLAEIQRKIEAADRAGDLAGVRAETARLMMLITQQRMEQAGANMGADNNMARMREAREYAETVVGDMVFDPIKRKQAIDAAIKQWLADNPPTTAAPSRPSVTGGKSGVF